MLTIQRTQMLEGLHQVVLYGNGLQITFWVRGDQKKASRVSRSAQRRLEAVLSEIQDEASDNVAG